MPAVARLHHSSVCHPSDKTALPPFPPEKWKKKRHEWREKWTSLSTHSEWLKRVCVCACMTRWGLWGDRRGWGRGRRGRNTLPWPPPPTDPSQPPPLHFLMLSRFYQSSALPNEICPENGRMEEAGEEVGEEVGEEEEEMLGRDDWLLQASIRAMWQGAQLATHDDKSDLIRDRVQALACVCVCVHVFVHICVCVCKSRKLRTNVVEHRRCPQAGRHFLSAACVRSLKI